MVYVVELPVEMRVTYVLTLKYIYIFIKNNFSHVCIMPQQQPRVAFSSFLSSSSFRSSTQCNIVHGVGAAGYKCKYLYFYTIYVEKKSDGQLRLYGRAVYYDITSHCFTLHSIIIPYFGVGREYIC